MQSQKILELKTLPNALGSNHHPYHLLCKIHTAEALDHSNLNVLAEVEKSVKQQEIFEGINPSIKSFFRRKSALVEALLNLIIHDKSGRSCSQADLFDHICEQEGIPKRVSLYQQRWFAKLEKTAAALMEAKDFLTILLDEEEATNQLIEACRMDISSELFITELECVAFFNYHVTFPFLHCIEMSSQVDLCRILPQLYHDLLDNKIDTLPNFVVKMHPIFVPEITSELAQNIINRMCSSAAAAVKQKCGREYGFSDGEKLRATDLSMLSASDLEGLPTNNLAAERNLSQFDREVKAARS